MNRFVNYPAVVLSVRSSGEANREAFFLTEEAGVIRATLYGGGKSSLRAYISPFHSGKVYLYFNPVRSSYKVSDFDVTSWRAGIRELYERTQAAFVISQAVLSGAGGGCNWSESFALVNASLDALEAAGKENAQKVLLHFLWNWIDVLGLKPDFEESSSRNFTRDEKKRAALAYLAQTEGVSPAGFLCGFPADAALLREAKDFVFMILSRVFGAKFSELMS